MGVTGDLVCRELLLLVLLAAAGAGPAWFLRAGFSRPARLALAPVLGLCVLVCLFTTLEWFFPGSSVSYVVPVVCALSLTVLAACAWRSFGHKAARHLRLGRSDVLGIVQILLVCVVVALPATSALASHDSVGPVSYEVYDGPGYVANADAAASLSISKAASLSPSSPNVDNYVDLWWLAEAKDSTRLDDAPVVAAVDSLVGLDATATYSADLIALIVAGALGMYAAILYACRRPTMFATLGALTFGGSFFLQLFFDGSQAAITGLVVIVPLIVLGFSAAQEPRPTRLALVALALGGLATLYPIFLSPLLVAGVLFVVGLLIVRRKTWKGRLVRTSLPVVLRIVAVVVLAALFDVVATVRDMTSLGSLLAGGGILSSFPAYHLGTGVVASWLLQTRDLYGVAFGPQSPLYDFVPALLIPLAVLVTALSGLRRRPVAWFALLVVAVACTIAAYETVRNGCGYCEDRSLLASVPPIVLLVFTGLGSAFSSGRYLRRAAVLVVSACFLSFVGYDAANVRTRFDTSSFFLTSSLRTLVAQIPESRRGTEIEGFDALPQAMAADTYVYELLFEHDPTVSAATEQATSGLAEDWGPKPLSSPIFHSDYAYVLTRLGSLQTQRRTIRRDGPVALERRASPLDVTVESGVRLTSPRARYPEVVSRIWFVVSGASRDSEDVRARFVLPTPALALPRQQGVHFGETGKVLQICVAAHREGRVETASLDLPADKGIVLREVRADPGRC